MNYSINAEKSQSQSYSQSQSQSNQSQPAGLMLAAYLSLQRLNRSMYQLEQISEGHPHTDVRKAAVKFLKKNEKLATISINLIERLKNFSSPTPMEVITTKKNETLIQLKMEVDMLDDMHFEVAKSYTTFIYQNYEATVIPMNVKE